MADKLKFFDLKAKQHFETDNYEVVIKETRRADLLPALKGEGSL